MASKKSLGVHFLLFIIACHARNSSAERECCVGDGVNAEEYDVCVVGASEYAYSSAAAEIDVRRRLRRRWYCGSHDEHGLYRSLRLTNVCLMPRYLLWLEER